MLLFPLKTLPVPTHIPTRPTPPPLSDLSFKEVSSGPCPPPLLLPYYTLIPGVTLHLFFIIACFTSSSLLKCTLLVVQSLSHIQLFAIPLTAAHQASLSFTISQSLLKLVSIESVMPSNYLIPCHPLILLPSIFPSIKAFSSESALHIMWPKD